MSDQLIQNHLNLHYVNRSNWLRAAVLGANDGILSTASIAMGVAAASQVRHPIVLASLAGLVAGAMSMAAGEYVSVSSQTDIETADIEREKKELEDMPQEELELLAKIFESRGLRPETALEVAEQLHEHDALAAHVREELGITEISQPKPLQAAFFSCLSFTLGGFLPFLTAMFAPLKYMVISQYIVSIIALILLGIISAKTGGSSIPKAIIRITFWGTVAMGITALVGHLFGVSVA